MTQKTATQPKPARLPGLDQPGTTTKLSKLDRLEALLRREGGASLAELVAAAGWQKHSIRGAMAGALKKRGLAITSEKLEGERRYRVAA
jgi:hypothetical protein